MNQLTDPNWLGDTQSRPALHIEFVVMHVTGCSDLRAAEVTLGCEDGPN